MCRPLVCLDDRFLLTRFNRCGDHREVEQQCIVTATHHCDQRVSRVLCYGAGICRKRIPGRAHQPSVLLVETTPLRALVFGLYCRIEAPETWERGRSHVLWPLGECNEGTGAHVPRDGHSRVAMRGTGRNGTSSGAEVDVMAARSAKMENRPIDGRGRTCGRDERVRYFPFHETAGTVHTITLFDGFTSTVPV